MASPALKPDSITLTISGLGIVFYSPSFAAAIQEGEDYFSTKYANEEGVQRHIQTGTIVGFGTGSSGTFILRFQTGYPTNEEVARREFALRLGVRVMDGMLCFRDLYDLQDWSAAVPEDVKLRIKDGIYHVTLLTDMPASGLLGDDQPLDVYFQPLEAFPALAKGGVPTLCR
jgi:hypothetical protein